MLEFAIAFLNSFRAHNPELPLCLVPFDENADKVASLQSEYDFTIWADTAALRRCDDISRHFHESAAGQYRKLALWEGIYDEFIYIDTDTVVLSAIEFVFPLISTQGLITSHSNIPSIRRWVWKDSIDAVNVLSEPQKSFAANTGFVASRRGYLSLDAAERKLGAGVELMPHMELSCTEQPFLNLLIVTSGHRYTSLHVLKKAHRLKLPEERWAGSEIHELEEGAVIPRSPATVLLVHWAGLWRELGTEAFPHLRLWSHYRYLRSHVNLVAQ